MEKLNIEDVDLIIQCNYEREVFIASIAISLKRIADALNNPDPYDNPIARAILNGISQGAQDWIGHMARNGR